MVSLATSFEHEKQIMDNNRIKIKLILNVEVYTPIYCNLKYLFEFMLLI